MQRKLHKGQAIRHLIASGMMIIVFPFVVLLDIIVEIYHHIAFPLCKIPLVKRRKYIIIDRHKLSYLNWIDKIACAYCGYANGWTRYLTEIGIQTEKYWCAIKHKEKSGVIEQPHQENFIPYDDKATYDKTYGKDKKIISKK